MVPVPCDGHQASSGMSAAGPSCSPAPRVLHACGPPCPQRQRCPAPRVTHTLYCPPMNNNNLIKIFITSCPFSILHTRPQAARTSAAPLPIEIKSKLPELPTGLVISPGVLRYSPHPTVHSCQRAVLLQQLRSHLIDCINQTPAPSWKNNPTGGQIPREDSASYFPTEPGYGQISNILGHF